MFFPWSNKARWFMYRKKIVLNVSFSEVSHGVRMWADKWMSWENSKRKWENLNEVTSDESFALFWTLTNVQQISTMWRHFINLTLYPSFTELCLITLHTYTMFSAPTGNDQRILRSSETNESAAHTWPLLALSCITEVTPHKMVFLCVLAHLLSLILIFFYHTHPCYLLPLSCLSFSQSCIRTSSSVTSLPFFYPHTACDIKCNWRLEGSRKKAFHGAVRGASVTVSTPVWCGGIHTWQINPCALSATHSAHVKSSALCRVRGDILERQTHCGEVVTFRNNTGGDRERGKPNEWRDWENRRKRG